ncbi:Flagellar motor switch protein FliN [Rubripirellula tenax]|uniref:Flagellar motor switch protein FliN n=1 Tax=Rubripirellula tenax TaxID=2528015 RepID=A0A5C6EPJ0_9BACT|nr:flagellar motor switch protein FliN [Rubripirellula tenax]TWU50808.1 Flagellar motor switch protein FliN [Rubripirellula tenax]
MADPNDEVEENEASADKPAVAAAGPDPADSKKKLNTDEIEDLLNQATASLDEAVGDNVSTEAQPKPFSFGDLTPGTEPAQRQPIDLLGEVEMDLRVELGRTQMRLEEVLQLRSGSVVALDKLAGDPVDIFVNGRLIARGEVLVMNDNFCIRVTELVGA